MDDQENNWRLLTEPGQPAVWFGKAEVLANVRVALDTYALQIAAPSLAQAIVPGQFIMIRLAATTDPLLGRAFALYDVLRNDSGQPRGLEIVYAAVGRMTQRLKDLPPTTGLEIWGPLGNGFPPVVRPRLILVAGGIGYTPFLAVSKEATGAAEYARHLQKRPNSPQIKLLFGVRNREYIPSDLSRFSDLGVNIAVSSDDGSIGQRGLVSDLLERELDGTVPEDTVVFCCGPEPLMAKTADLCLMRGVECYVSLETPMACGLGLCYSCVARIRGGDPQSQEWDYRRVCVEGPVFEASRVVFD